MYPSQTIKNVLPFVERLTTARIVEWNAEERAELEMALADGDISRVMDELGDFELTMLILTYRVAKTSERDKIANRELPELSLRTFTKWQCRAHFWKTRLPGQLPELFAGSARRAEIYLGPKWADVDEEIKKEAKFL